MRVAPCCVDIERFGAKKAALIYQHGRFLPEIRQAQAGEEGRAGRKVNLTYRSSFPFQPTFGVKLRFFPADVQQVLHRQAQRVVFTTIIRLQVRHEVAFCNYRIVFVGGSVGHVPVP